MVWLSAGQSSLIHFRYKISQFLVNEIGQKKSPRAAGIYIPAAGAKELMPASVLSGEEFSA